MNLQELMTELARANIKLALRDGDLAVSAAKGALTADLRAQLGAHKEQIVALLGRSGGTPAAPRQIEPDQENRYAPFPFSDLQVAFYMANDPFLEYHVRPHYYCETDFDGLDVPRYERALNRAMERHRGEVVLVCGDGELQALRDVPPIRLQLHDLRDASEAEAHTRLMSLRASMERQELPLDRWPWFDVCVSLWREGGRERARIHFNHNNFYSDGYGGMILQREIDRFYADPNLDAKPLSLTFRDAVTALQALSESPDGMRARRYWLDRLEALPEPPALPQLAGVERRCRSRLQRRQGTLSPAQWAGFKEHAARHGLTPTSAVISAYAEILCAWSGSQHFILSNMVTRRLPLHPEIGEMIGNFASLYPLEVDLRGGGAFAERAQRMQQQILRDSANREWGGMQVMQALNRLKGEFGSVPCPFVVGSGLFLDTFRKADYSCLETAQTIFDHQFWELDDGSYYYVWDLLEQFFPAGMIDAMWQGFGALLARLASSAGEWQQKTLHLAPAAPLAQPPQVDGRTRGPLLHDGLSDVVQATPDRPFLVTPRGRMTYAELDRRSDAVAAALAGKAAPNELIALVMDRGADLLAATLGILKAGAAYVPIDAKLPAQRIAYMLENSRARCVLTDSGYRAAVEWPANVDVIAVEDLPAVPVMHARARPDDLAYVIYTSGSTGNPKGVMIEHAAALTTIRDINDRFGVSADDVVLGVSSFSFDLSVYDVFGVLDAGATLVYPDPDAALNPAHWLELMSRHGVTVWNSAPPLMSLLAETAQRQGVTLPALRLVMLSGDWIPVDLPRQLRALAPNARIVSLGGATEAAIWSIYYDIGDVDPSWTSIPYGRALAGQGWRVLDPQGRDCPLWTTGDLYITGAGLARGYWADADKTAASFIGEGSVRRYRTGDRGRVLPDGNIEFMGRADTQVKVQGHRIELGEVEAALAACPQVREAVVLALPAGVAPGTAVPPNHPKQLVAYVVADGAAQDELRAWLGTKLPVHMAPTGWAMLDRMPINSNGKIDRKALAQLAHSGMARPDAPQEYIAPRTPTEAGLAEIWRGLLKLDKVGVREDFFAVGGQSFDAVRCVALIQERFGRALSLSDMWQGRTIEALALRLDGAAQERQGHLQQVGPRKPGNSLYLVHPAGGQLVGYYDLAQALARNCAGFVATADDAASDGLATIELIAAHYVRELLQEQPAGPYSLAGWSSGGCIAFEMALQLETMGHQVDHLVLLDCPGPQLHSRIDELDMMRGFFEDLDLGLDLEGLDAVADAAIGTEARFASLAAHLDRDGRSLNAADLYPFYRVFKKVVDAVRAYRPERTCHARQVLVLRASEGSVGEFAGHPHADRDDWGWRSLLDGELLTAWLPGSHYTMLRGAHVPAVAALLNRHTAAAPAASAA